MPANNYIFVLTNPGAETGSISGWTANGGFGVRTADPSPRTGSYYFQGGNQARGAAWQDISITNNVANTDIDTGQALFFFTWYQAAYNSTDDLGTISIHFMDAVGAPISNIVLPYVVATRNWDKREYAGNLVPALTRTVRVQMNAIRVGGTNNDTYFDDLSEVVISYGANDANLTSEYIEAGTVVSNTSTNITSEYIEVGSFVENAPVNITSEYIETGIVVETAATNITSEYVEVAANSTLPEPRITAEYIEVGAQAYISTAITSEYVEVGTRVITPINVTSEYVEVGTGVITPINVTSEYVEVGAIPSGSSTNITSQYIEITEELGKGSVNLYQYRVESITGLMESGNTEVSFMYVEVITVPRIPQVLVAGI